MKFENVGIMIVGFALVGLLTYGGYWIAKTVSYKIFYSAMVEGTVTDMVKPECLNQ